MEEMTENEKVLFAQLSRLSYEYEREKRRHRDTKQKLLNAMESKEFHRGMALGHGDVSKYIARDVVELIRKEWNDTEGQQLQDMKEDFTNE